MFSLPVLPKSPLTVVIYFSICALQLEEVVSIIDSREELGSVILRNTSLDDSELEKLAPSLKNSPDLKVRLIIFPQNPNKQFNECYSCTDLSDYNKVD